MLLQLRSDRVCAACPSVCTATRRSPGRGDILVQRLAQLEAVLRQRALDHARGRPSATSPFAQHAVQLDQRAALLARISRPGGVAVQPVGELEELRLRPRRAQRLDDPEAHPAAAVDRDAGRLVDHQERVVFVDDRAKSSGLGPCARSCLRQTRTGGMRTRSPDLQPVVGLHPPAVDPHFAAAQHPVDVAFRHAFQLAQEEVVDALGLAFFADFQPHWPSVSRGLA